MTMTHRAVFLFVLAAACSVAASSVDAATYYVRKTGSDANDCTNATTRACLTIARGAQVATQAGDIVDVGAGTYSEDVALTRSGSAGNRITFRGHNGGGCPSTANSDPNAPARRPAPTVITRSWTVNASHIRVECFWIKGVSTTAIRIEAARTDIDIVWNRTNDDAGEPTSSAFVYLAGSSFANMPQNIYVANNYATRGAYGFILRCRNCVVEDNEVFRLEKGATVSGDSDYSRIFGDNITLRRNYFHGSKKEPCGTCHMDCFQSFNVGGTDTFATNILIDSNTCRDMHQGILVREVTTNDVNQSAFSNWTVTNNVFGPTGDLGGTISIGFETVKNAVVHNNTFLMGGSFIKCGTTARWHNNVYFAGGFAPYRIDSCEVPATYLSCGNNLLFEAGRQYSPTGQPGGAGCWAKDVLNQNPLFTQHPSDLRPLVGSPVIDAGFASFNPGHDRDGTVRDPLPDIGAYEFGGRPAAPQAPTNLLILR